MKIKRILAASLLGAVIISNGCNEEILDQQPFGLTEATYFEDEIDFERLIWGTYAPLTDIYWFNANNPPHAFWLLPGDDLTQQSTNPFDYFFSLNPATGTVGYIYSQYYQFLNRVNTALQIIDTRSEGIYVTPNLKTFHQGEALFLRGYVFFQLWNFFGTSPVITSRIQDLARTQPPSSTGTQLLDQAIADLQQAAEFLPTSWSADNRGRVTKNSAYGLLGKALVFRGTVNNNSGDFSAAVSAFNSIGGNIRLVENFGDNFAADTENNAESLFEHQASRAPGENVWLGNEFDNAIGSRTCYWGFFDEGAGTLWSVGGQPFIATQKLADAFEAADPRLALTLDIANNTINKYILRNQLSGENVGSLNNPRILRYGDVLLLKAEAVLNSGGSTGEAVKLINQVRTRAREMVAGGTVPANYDSTATDRDEIMEWIMNERFIELAAEEGHRWMDLRRWHLGDKINLSTWDFGSVNDNVDFDVDKNLYYPIPTSEVDNNVNAVQNPNY